MMSSFKGLKKVFYIDNRLNLVSSLFFMVIFGGLNIYTAFLFKKLTDLAIGGTVGALVNFIKFTGIYLIVYIVVAIIKTYCLNKYTYKAMTQYKNYIFEKLLAKKNNIYNNETTGKYLTTLTNDIESIEKNYVIGNIVIIYQVFLLTCALLVMLYLNWLVTLAVIIATLLPLALSVLIGNNMSKREKDVSLCNASFIDLVRDILNGFSVIKNFKAENNAFNNFKKLNANL